MGELAKTVRASLETIRDWRKRGYGPRGVRVGGRVLYRRADVVAWLDEQAELSGTAAGSALRESWSGA
jgi:DNA-binding transcriptional MerR regulator